MNNITTECLKCGTLIDITDWYHEGGKCNECSIEHERLCIDGVEPEYYDSAIYCDDITLEQGEEL